MRRMFVHTIDAGGQSVQFTTNTDDPATLTAIGEQLAPHVQPTPQPEPPKGGGKIGGSGVVQLPGAGG